MATQDTYDELMDRKVQLERELEMVNDSIAVIEAGVLAGVPVGNKAVVGSWELAKTPGRQTLKPRVGWWDDYEAMAKTMPEPLAMYARSLVTISVEHNYPSLTELKTKHKDTLGGYFDKVLNVLNLTDGNPGLKRVYIGKARPDVVIQPVQE